MCPWTKIHKEKQERGDMPPEVWQALRPHLDEVQSIDFSGGGEPLLQPRLVEWITEANTAGCETGFLTNGFLLKRETAEQMISAGLDWIAFSMDGATADIYEKIRASYHPPLLHSGRTTGLRPGPPGFTLHPPRWIRRPLHQPCQGGAHRLCGPASNPADGSLRSSPGA